MFVIIIKNIGLACGYCTETVAAGKTIEMIGGIDGTGKIIILAGQPNAVGVVDTEKYFLS